MPDTQSTRTPAQRRAERDRQELWYLDNFLAVNATTERQRERYQRLHGYLCETCPHDYGDVSGWGGSPKGTHQCRQCSNVLTPDEWADYSRTNREAAR